MELGDEDAMRQGRLDIGCVVLHVVEVGRPMGPRCRSARGEIRSASHWILAEEADAVNATPIRFVDGRSIQDA